MTESQGPSWRTVVYVVVSVTAFGGGGALYNRINDPRPDPYTGSDAATQTAVSQARYKEILERLHRIELTSQQIRSDLDHMTGLFGTHRERLAHPAPK